MVKSVDHIEHRGLAGAIWPDDRENLAPLDGEADPVERGNSAKGQSNGVSGQTGSPICFAAVI
jgi:hypothetical protein